MKFLTAIICLLFVATITIITPCYSSEVSVDVEHHQQQRAKTCSTSSDFKTENVVTCSACKLVISTLDAMLTDPDNQLAIANALDEICSLFVDSFVAECHFMICTYYDDLINLAVSEFGDPDKVCNFLTLCP